MNEALEILLHIDATLDKHGPNCKCEVGGVDAISIDIDWLQHQLAKAIDALKGE